MASLIFLALMWAVFGVFGALSDAGSCAAPRTVPRPGDDVRRPQHLRRRAENREILPL